MGKLATNCFSSRAVAVNGERYFHSYELNKKKVDLGHYSFSYLASDEARLKDKALANTAIVFLHSGFASSFTWRKVIDQLADGYHCYAPDLLGIKPGQYVCERAEQASHYTFQEQAQYLDLFLDVVVRQQRVILVMQGAGSVLGCDWALRNQHRIQGIAHIGGIFAEPMDEILGSDRVSCYYHALLKKLVHDRDAVREFISKRLGGACGPWELAQYMQPFLRESSRKVLSLLSLFPLKGMNKEVKRSIISYTHWLKTSSLPKLMIEPLDSDPFLLPFTTTALVFEKQCVEAIEGQFYLQETSPELVAHSIHSWLHKIKM